MVAVKVLYLDFYQSIYPSRGRYNFLFIKNELGVGVTPHIIKGSIKENLLYGNKEKFDDTYLSRMLEEFDIFDNKKISLNDKKSAIKHYLLDKCRKSLY